MSSLDLNEEKEKEMIDVVFSNAVDSLAEEDRKLPQVHRGYTYSTVQMLMKSRDAPQHRNPPQ